jgi:diguanylate cyclase (GGDEF)-like protein
MAHERPDGAEWNEALGEQVRRATAYAAMAVVISALLCIPAVMIGSSLADGVGRLFAIALAMMFLQLPVVACMLVSTVRQESRIKGTVRDLELRLTGALERAEEDSEARQVQARRQDVETQLANGLQMTETEDDVLGLVERALGTILPDAPAELLLADNSHAHLSRVATSSPTGDAPGCGVESPNLCPAARRTQVQRFTDSERLDACPQLLDRPIGRCAALCVPVSIMGRAVGVIHSVEASSSATSAFDDEHVQVLSALANLAGTRIGVIRMMAESQLQAATDSLTGLLNRRALENRVRERRADEAFVVVVADLDHFKRLNDTYGHETGDRALRLFAHTLTESLREGDLVSRHGGEEFVAVLWSTDAAGAVRALEAVRVSLVAAIAAAGLPRFTASFGAVESHDREHLQEAITRADAALLVAKAGGRDRIVIHDDAGSELVEIDGHDDIAILPRRAEATS